MQLLGFGATAEPCAVRKEWQPGLGCAEVLQAGRDQWGILGCGTVTETSSKCRSFLLCCFSSALKEEESCEDEMMKPLLIHQISEKPKPLQKLGGWNTLFAIVRGNYHGKAKELLNEFFANQEEVLCAKTQLVLLRAGRAVRKENAKRSQGTKDCHGQTTWVEYQVLQQGPGGAEWNCCSFI